MSRRLGELLTSVRKRLGEAPFEVSQREALLLLSRVLQLSEAQILANVDRAIAPGDVDRLEQLVARRVRGEPVAYLFREKEFYGRGFLVDPRVLIPRPETEHLVEAALAIDLPSGASVLDVGTGSGCIAVTLALEKPLVVHAVDRSLDALEVARFNATRHGARVSLAATDLVSPIAPGSFDLVVANLPYVAEDERSRISTEILEYEPEAALFAEDGLGAFRQLFAQVGAWERRPPLVLEIGSEQAESVAQIAERHGYLKPRTIKDYAGLDRVLILQG